MNGNQHTVHRIPYFFLLVGLRCGVAGRPEFTPWY